MAYDKGYEICEHYTKLPKKELISLCVEIAEETELFCDKGDYIVGLKKLTVKKLAVTLRSLEFRKEFMNKDK